jgi:hypothetical protein
MIVCLAHELCWNNFMLEYPIPSSFSSPLISMAYINYNLKPFRAVYSLDRSYIHYKGVTGQLEFEREQDWTWFKLRWS